MKPDESFHELNHCSKAEKGDIRAEEAVLRELHEGDTLELSLEGIFQKQREQHG